MHDRRKTTTGKNVHEIRVRHVCMPSVGHVNSERLKRHRFEVTAYLLGCHLSINAVLATLRQAAARSKCESGKDAGFEFQISAFNFLLFPNLHFSFQLLRSRSQSRPSHSSREIPACLSSRFKKPTPISPSCSLGMINVRFPRLIWGVFATGERALKAKFMHSLNEFATGNRIQFRHSLQHQSDSD